MSLIAAETSSADLGMMTQAGSKTDVPDHRVLMETLYVDVEGV